MPLYPSEQVRCFAFAGTEALYRDHLGRRVVADAEGAGILTSVVAETPVTVCFDDREGVEFPVLFERYLTVIAEGEGVATCRICMGQMTDLIGAGVQVELPYEGSGWLVEGSAVADERHEVDCLPAPFFQSLQGSGPASIVEGDLICRPLMSLDVNDPESLKTWGFQVQNMSKVFPLDSCFADGTHLATGVASHLNRATWWVDLPDGCIGLLLRKTYDRFHGRQRARVLVNGDLMGMWYEPFEDRECRWAVGQFGFPLSAAGRIHIAIDPPPSTPLWSFARVEVLSLVRS